MPDVKCGTDDELRASVKLIRAAQDEYARRRHLQTLFMDRHDLLDDGFVRVTYSNGARLYVNYRDVPCTADGVTVPAHDYKVDDLPKYRVNCFRYHRATKRTRQSNERSQL